MKNKQSPGLVNSSQESDFKKTETKRLEEEAKVIKKRRETMKRRKVEEEEEEDEEYDLQEGLDLLDDKIRYFESGTTGCFWACKNTGNKCIVAFGKGKDQLSFVKKC